MKKKVATPITMLAQDEEEEAIVQEPVRDEDEVLIQQIAQDIPPEEEDHHVADVHEQGEQQPHEPESASEPAESMVPAQ